jgi:hypothetical protein
MLAAGGGLTRAPEDRTLECMGVAAAKDEAGSRSFKLWQIRPGALFIEGRVASQGVGHPGGGRQAYVLDPDADLLEP